MPGSILEVPRGGSLIDSLKLIPSVFFDLIGRVIPGSLALISVLILTESDWQSWLQDSLGRSVAASAPISVFLFGIGAYVAGQLISPLAKGMQRVGELAKPMQKSSDYDWLRMHHERAGSYCAKIRAEFTMHNGIAVVLLASSLAYPFSTVPWSWIIQAALVVGGVLAAVRGRTTRDTFHETVRKFARAAQEGVAGPST